LGFFVFNGFLKPISTALVHPITL